MQRPLAELAIAVVASTLIGFGLTKALGTIGWETAIGLGLLLMALVSFGLPVLMRSLPVKVLLAILGLILILLPYFRV